MPTSNPTQVISNGFSFTNTEALAAALDYWTEDRISRAKPLPVPKVYMPGGPTELVAMANVESTMIISPYIPPGPNRAPLDSPGFSTHLVADMTSYPYAVVGKLYMTFGNNNYVGTAWVVGERAVFTAGHCVHDKSSNSWAKNVLFKPQFNNGNQLDSWALPALASLKGWVEDEDFRFDMGITISGTAIRPATGKAGYIVNIDEIQGKIKSIGYPAEEITGYDFSGERMWENEGGYRSTNAEIMSMDNNMTGGCSGGPWMYSQNNQFYAIGLNSFRYNSEPNILRSPFFGQSFQNMIQWMKDNGGDA